jgi:hypothetical protein
MNSCTNAKPIMNYELRIINYTFPSTLFTHITNALRTTVEHLEDR